MILSLLFFSRFILSNSASLIEREHFTSLKYYGHDLNSNNDDQINHQTNKKLEDITRWLEHVPNSTLINSISLPGTHESCCRVGGPAIQTQDWNILTQLQNGVRMLDIRCRHINDCFMIHHDFVYQQLSFASGVRDVCRDFLVANPTEFIYMIIKSEYKESECTRSFEDTLRSYIIGYEKFFYLTENSPTLEKVRGKIVILRRFERKGPEPLGNYLNFKDNSIFTSFTTITARIQDCYYVSTIFDRSAKWNQVSQILTEARQNTDQNELFINFASGSSAWCYPYSTADYVIPLVGSYLKTSYPNAFVGVIMFDYINSNFNDLITYLVNRNF